MKLKYAFALVEDGNAEDIGRQQIGSELNALELGIN